jgi:hypothetical protein
VRAHFYLRAQPHDDRILFFVFGSVLTETQDRRSFTGKRFKNRLHIFPRLDRETGPWFFENHNSWISDRRQRQHQRLLFTAAKVSAYG